MNARVDYQMLSIVETRERPRLYCIGKRLLDILVSAGALIVLFPVMLIIALLILITSPGPVIFRQERVGSRRKNSEGRTYWVPTLFTMYKFRTMYQNADSGVHRSFMTAFINNDQRAMAAIQGTKTETVKIVNDRRITPVGKFLRRSSLDELPQLWNILVGDMTLVGPRPPLLYEVEAYKPWHRRRLEAKPGLTGLWQVVGRSSATFDEMVELDIWYIKHQSLWLDVKILLGTVMVVFSGKGGL